MRNDTEAAKRLIEQGANPCCEDQRQWSPLIWAASHGNEDLTRLLIKHNAAEVYKSDETKVRKKHSPLHWAAFKGHLKAGAIGSAGTHSSVWLRCIELRRAVFLQPVLSIPT
ncbi:kidins220b [Symbiodinium sp. CCMP2592]|nr:kidins220b [Symbiodinium sp. CCMP2592]